MKRRIAVLALGALLAVFSGCGSMYGMEATGTLPECREGSGSAAVRSESPECPAPAECGTKGLVPAEDGEALCTEWGVAPEVGDWALESAWYCVLSESANMDGVCGVTLLYLDGGGRELWVCFGQEDCPDPQGVFFENDRGSAWVWGDASHDELLSFVRVIEK